MCVVLGIELRGILPLSYTPSPILFLIWKQGLTRLVRVSLLAEAVLEPAILLSQSPKYWDYKRAPPRPACHPTSLLNLKCYLISSKIFVCEWHWGLNPEAFYLRATPPAQFYFLFGNRLSLGC